MFSSKRLLIKAWSLDQASDFYRLSLDDGFNSFPITVYRQADLSAAVSWIRAAINLNHETRLGKWGVWERESGELIGMGGLTPWSFEDESLVDITYRLQQSAWGKGYGLELAQSLIVYGFKQGLKQITATITPDNIASKKIAEKIGMKFDCRIELLGVPTDLYRLAKT